MAEAPCKDESDKIDTLYDKWAEENKEANEAAWLMVGATGLMAGLCGASVFITPLVGECASATAAAAAAVGNSFNETFERNAASSKLSTAYNAYKECVQNHKWYYGPSLLP
jgi:hypothetical protein